MKVIEIDITALVGGYDSYENDCIWIAIPDDHDIHASESSCLTVKETNVPHDNIGVDLFVVPEESGTS